MFFLPSRRMAMKASISKKTLVMTMSALLIGVCGMARADETQFDKNHPRRAEVNGRLANQNARINKEVKEGEINKGQARALHRQDRAVRQEERDMAGQNGGHITPAEQRVLNQQENGISR